jgi:hypothetical protein
VSDDFYVGYEPEMPPAFVRPVRLAAAMLVLGACALAVGLVLAQQAPSDGVFEFGRERQFEGLLLEHPYPLLRASDGGRYWLVGPGKRGASALAGGLDGRTARVRGTLIRRGGDRMLQIDAGSIVATAAAPQEVAPLTAGAQVTLEGEIVDSKCHLGVMKPGEGPAHRDCAVRCLLGDVPPMLVVRDGARVRRVPLVSMDGGPLRWDPEPLTARQVRVTGRLYTRDGDVFLEVAVADLPLTDELE